MKKKILISVIFLICLSFSKNNCNAVSENFKFVIDTIGVPRYNVYMDEINEEVYYTYNVFVYSSPLNMYNKTTTQRFKAVPYKGKWTENGGAYNGNGNRGEYYVLGTSYSGSLIDNVYFPVDAMPETTPDKWQYISFDGAYNSWYDNNNFKYSEQLEFMKNNKLLFDELDFLNNISNSYNLIEYGVSPSKIGLDKTRLNTSSTWKTMGIVSAKRINNKGQIRNVIFASKPMAASANIKSNLFVDDIVTLTENQDNIKIPFKFGSEAINLNDYANEKHIKEICSIIYINGKEYSRVSGSKTVKLDKNIEFTVSRDEYNTPNDYTLNVKVLSYLYTEFSVDGLMQNTIEKNITIKVQNKKIVPIKDIDLKILKKENEKLVVSPLVQTLNTKKENSIGFVEAGRNIALNLNLNVKYQDIQKLNIYLNKNKLNYDILSQKDEKILLSIKLDENLDSTIASWNYLRNKNNDYFKVDFNDIGNRIKNPNILQILIKINNIEYTKEISFDSVDNYNINMQYQFDNNVINKNELNEKTNIEEWN